MSVFHFFFSAELCCILIERIKKFSGQNVLLIYGMTHGTPGSHGMFTGMDTF